MIQEITIQYKISGLIWSEMTLLHGLRAKSEFKLGNISGRSCSIKDISKDGVVVGISNSNLSLSGEYLIENKDGSYEVYLKPGNEVTLLSSAVPSQKIALKLIKIDEKERKFIA